MQNEPAFARQALQAGASGYVIKHAAGVRAGHGDPRRHRAGTYVTPSLGAKLAAEPEETVPDELTPREVEVLGLLARGFTNPEIAEELTLSVRTIETHRANILRKTDRSTRAELIAYAIDHDLVER